jgi:release factor glutamine methyltransferase
VNTARDLLALAKDLGLPLSEARGLICHGIERPKEWLIAHDQDLLNLEQSERCQTLLRKRAIGEPYAYLIGRQEFYGRDFIVSPSVLIPRPDTELLIDSVLKIYSNNESLQVIDLGTGSGCIAITLALERPSWQVLATDVSPAAIQIAQENAVNLKANNVQFVQSSWWQQVQGKFDLIVSNPPYIDKDDEHLCQGDLRFEPKNALTDHADGLSAYREILAGLAPRAKKAAHVFLEHGYDQAVAVANLIKENHLHIVEQKKDLGHQQRLMIAKIQS